MSTMEKLADHHQVRPEADRDQLSTDDAVYIQASEMLQPFGKPLGSICPGNECPNIGVSEKEGSRIPLAVGQSQVGRHLVCLHLSSSIPSPYRGA